MASKTGISTGSTILVAIAFIVACQGVTNSAEGAAERDIMSDDPQDFIMGFDVDGDEKLSKEEYAEMIVSLLPDDEGELEDSEDTALAVVAAFERHDVSGDGKLDFDEIIAMLMPKFEQASEACGATGIEDDAEPSEFEQETEDEDEADLSDIPPEYFNKDFVPPVENMAWGEEDDEDYFGGQDPSEFAMQYDKNNDGLLSMGEFLIMMEEGGDEDEDAISFFKHGDMDKDGKLNQPEIMTLFYNPSFNARQASSSAREDSSHASFNTPDPSSPHAKLTALDSRQLFAIVQDGSLQELEEALGMVYSADGGAQEQECTPLHMALSLGDVWNHNRHLEPNAQHNYTAAALMLMEHGADLRMECEGRSPLHLAVQYRNRIATDAILREIRGRIEGGSLPQSTLEWTAAASDVNPGGGSALHSACDVHGLAIGAAKILVAHPGAGRSVVEAWQRSGPQRQDMFPGGVPAGLHDSFAEWGLTLPRDILRSQGTTFKRPALSAALSVRSAELVSVLLGHGLDANARDLDQQTPLHVAAMAGDAAVCRLLLEAGADPSARGDAGFTPAERAVQGGHKEAAELLLAALEERGDKEGVRAMTEAAGWRRVLEEGERSESVWRGSATTEGGRDEAMCGGEKTGGAGSGGWKGGCRADLEIDYCDIDSVDAGADNVMEVVREHQRLQRPLLMRGAIRSEDWEGMRVWSREGMREYAERSERAWKVFRQRDGSKQSIGMSMGEYLDAMEKHDPDTDPAPDWLVEFGLQDGDELVDSHNAIVKRYFAHLYDEEGLGLSNYQFMVAPVFTGASPHFHFTSARLMVHGRARWFLWPVAQSVYSSRDIHTWYQKDYPTLAGPERPLECVQGAGDLMFVPTLWGHGVLYLEDTAGMASLFRS